MTFTEQQSELRELLGKLTTAENAEIIAGGIKTLEAMSETYGKAVKDGQEAKDALVRLVTTTPVKAPQPTDGDPKHEDAPRSIDDIIGETISEIVAKSSK